MFGSQANFGLIINFQICHTSTGLLRRVYFDDGVYFDGSYFDGSYFDGSYFDGSYFDGAYYFLSASTPYFDDFFDDLQLIGKQSKTASNLWNSS